MITLSLFAMCGILGLAVDLSWSYFVHRAAQKAADAGALAAAEQYLLASGPGPYASATAWNYQCPSGITTVTDTRDSGCIYMRGPSMGTGAWYGFVDGSNSGRAQGARLDATTDPAVIHGAEGASTTGLGLQINALYAVRARAWEDVPQLFSAVLGNTTGRVAARATAAIVKVPWNIGVWGLNRGCPPTGAPPGCAPDPSPNVPNGVGGKNAQSVQNAGTDIYMQGNATLNIGGATLALASQQTPQSATSPAPTGDSTGSPNITDGATIYNSSTGGPVSGQLTNAYPNQQPHMDFSGFVDPMAGLSSPTLPSGSLPSCEVPLDAPLPVAGNTSNKPGIPSGWSLGPGIYYATKNGQPVSDPIVFQGDAAFTSSSGTCFSSTPSSNPSGFGNYVIFGGLNNSGGNFTFDPGKYVLAGAQQQSSGIANPVLSVGQNAGMSDTGSTGETFILTDWNYPGLTTLLQNSGSPLYNNNALYEFRQGYTYVQGGNSSPISLNGIDPTSTAAQNNGLTNYGQLLFWQDRRNSTVKYFRETAGNHQSTDGHVNCDGQVGDYMSGPTCDNTVPDPSKTDPATENGVDAQKTSPSMTLQGAPHMTLNGLIYQPRGALVYIQGGGSGSSVQGELQLVTGSIYLAGSATISSPLGPSNPLLHTVATLVQ